MPPFEYTPFVNPYAPSIGDLLLRGGDIAAHEATAKGAAWAGAAHDIGQAVSGTIQQATDPARQLQAQQVDANKRGLAFTATVNRIVSTLTQQNPDGSRTLDRGKLQQGFSAANVPPAMQEQMFKSLDDVDASIAKFNAARTDHLADLAHSVLTNPHGVSPETLAMGVALAQANGMVTADQVKPITEAVARGADLTDMLTQIRGLSEKYKDLSKPVVLAENAKLVNPLAAPGAPPIAENVDPNKGDYTINGQRFHNGVAVGPLVPKQTEPAKPGSPEYWVERALRMAVAGNGGKPLTDEEAKGVEGAALGEYKTANADPALRDAALAQKNIAGLLAQAQMNLMPTKEQAADVASDLVNHRLAPEQLASLFSTRGKEGLAFKLAVSSEAKKLEPSFNWEEASATYTLAKSTGFQNTVRYMDSAMESIPRLMKTATSLGNGQFKTWNSILNAGKNPFNDTDLKRFKTDALLVGDEVAKILSGGGTGSATSDAKLKQATEIAGQSDSVPAIAAAMDEVNTLLGNRRRALTRGTYMEGTAAVKTPDAARTAPPLTPGLQRLQERP